MKQIEEMESSDFIQIFEKYRVEIQLIEAFLESLNKDPKAPPIPLITALAELIVKCSFTSHRRTDEEHVREGLENAANLLVSYGLALRTMMIPTWEKYTNDADSKTH